MGHLRKDTGMSKTTYLVTLVLLGRMKYKRKKKGGNRAWKKAEGGRAK